MSDERAVIYLRVSRTEQTEESQLSPCKKFCEEHNFDIVSIQRDHGKSAYKSIQRKGYDNVINMVKNKQVDHVVVWSLDRWTRRGTKELRNTISYLEKYRVQLHSVQERWIDEITKGDLSFVRDIVLDVLGWVAQHESERIGDRIKTSIKYQKAKDKGEVGRPSIKKQVEKEVIKYLEDGKSYRWIRDNVTYKAKFGKIKNPSIATISAIKKSLENRYTNSNQKKSKKSKV